MTSRLFSAYRQNLNMVPFFMNLGRVLLAAYDDWPAVIRNLTKVWVVWWRILRIRSRERARAQVS